MSEVFSLHIYSMLLISEEIRYCRTLPYSLHSWRETQPLSLCNTDRKKWGRDYSSTLTLETAHNSHQTENLPSRPRWYSEGPLYEINNFQAENTKKPPEIASACTQQTPPADKKKKKKKEHRILDMSLLLVI